MNGPIRHDVRSVDTELVIVVRNLRGGGVDGDPVRLVTTYWTMDGNRLLEVDEWDIEQQRAKAAFMLAESGD